MFVSIGQNMPQAYHTLTEASVRALVLSYPGFSKNLFSNWLRLTAIRAVLSQANEDGEEHSVFYTY